MLAGKFSADVFDLAIKYGLCSELLRWQARPVMFAQEVRARVKSAADLLSDVFKDKSLHTSLNLVSKAVGQDDWATLSSRCQELKSLSSQSWDNKQRINELTRELQSVFPFMASFSDANQLDSARKVAMATFARDFSSTVGLTDDDGRRFVAVMNAVRSWDVLMGRGNIG